MQFAKPIKHLIITQPFGVNYVYKGFYSKLGIPSDMHNGIDFRLTRDKKVFATHDGIIKTVKEDKIAGNLIKLFAHNGSYRTRYLHLEKSLVRVNQKVKAGDLIALGGDTGTACKGPHLHYDKRFFDGLGRVLNLDNGYHGLVDPMSDFEKDDFKFPIELKYGKQQNWIIEFCFRFANKPLGAILTPFLKKQVEKGIWVHRQLIARGRKPSSLTVKEMNAIIYGGHTFEDAIDPAMVPVTYFLTRREYKSGIKPPIRLII